MLKKILPLVLLLIGAGAGVGAGIFLRPPAAETEHAEEGQAEVHGEAAPKAPAEDDPGDEPLDHEYVKLSNQFVVPVVKGDKVTSLVVMSLSLEVPVGKKDEVLAREPKLRDSFLRVLFNHANIGGFEGAFTESDRMEVLRTALREVAQKDMGADVITDILILEIARQDY